MPITLRESDVKAILDVADSARRIEASEGSVQELLAVLSQAVRCDHLYWNRLRHRPRVERIAEVEFPVPPPPPKGPCEMWDEWAAHLPEHPVMSGRYGSVVAFSDVYPEGRLHETWLYRELLRPAGVEHEIGVHLTHPQDQTHIVAMSRGPGSDFDERDHLVLRLLRPHLDAAFRYVSGMVPRLTPRESEVLRLVRQGLTNQQIARQLGVRETTVAKHLEHIYARTGTRSRVQAVNICVEALG